jgi:hypothetical protein
MPVPQKAYRYCYLNTPNGRCVSLAEPLPEPWLQLYKDGGGADDFERTRDNLPGRPWLLDDVDTFLVQWRMEPFPYTKAVLFVVRPSFVLAFADSSWGS